MVPILETERLLLRGHRLDDFEASAAMWADPRVVKFISGDPSTRHASWARMLRHAGMWHHLGYGYWVAEAKSDGRFIGEIGFADFKRDMVPAIDGLPEAGWVLSSAEHGKGYASEAVGAALDWADRVAGLARTVCIIAPAHEASINVARKLGFRDRQEASYQDEPVALFSRPRFGSGA